MDKIEERVELNRAHPIEQVRIYRDYQTNALDRDVTSYGRTRTRVREFLNACDYVIQNVSPADERTLLGAIMSTKLRGKAMMDFHTRDVRSYAQLKADLESEYLSTRSTIHLQKEFNTLKQRAGENAQSFGRRVDVSHGTI